MLTILNRTIAEETVNQWIDNRNSTMNLDDTDFPIGTQVCARFRMGLVDNNATYRLYRSTETDTPFHYEGYNTNMLRYWLDGGWIFLGSTWGSSGTLTGIFRRIY